MINIRNSLREEKITLPQKALALFISLVVAAISFPMPFNYFRPDLFLVLIIHFSLNSHEEYFGMTDAFIFGLFANFCYPVFFGSLSFLYISIFYVLKIYNARLRNYSNFMIYATLFLLVLISKLFALFAYDSPITGDFLYVLFTGVVSSFLILVTLTVIFRQH